jgi:hypothetical protein
MSLTIQRRPQTAIVGTTIAQRSAVGASRRAPQPVTIDVLNATVPARVDTLRWLSAARTYAAAAHAGNQAEPLGTLLNVVVA